MAIQADLSPHLHTVECNFLVKLWQNCKREKSLFRRLVFQDCENWYLAMAECLHQERMYRRETNKSRKRLVENQRLPEEKYTRVLRKLKDEGKLNLDDDKSGCCDV